MPGPAVRVILDVQVEDLAKGLADMGWDVATVTAELGFENRDDDKILDHARRNGLAVVTDDKKFVKRLQEAGIPVATMSLADRLMAVHRKLESMEACTCAPGSGQT